MSIPSKYSFFELEKKVLEAIKPVSIKTICTVFCRPYGHTQRYHSGLLFWLVSCLFLVSAGTNTHPPYKNGQHSTVNSAPPSTLFYNLNSYNPLFIWLSSGVKDGVVSILQLANPRLSVRYSMSYELSIGYRVSLNFRPTLTYPYVLNVQTPQPPHARYCTL